MLTTKTRLTLYIITGLVLVLIIGAVVLMNPGSPAESVADLLSLGNRFLSELNYEQALVQFLRVIEIEPRSAQAYYGAARAHIGLGQIDDAIDILRQGIEMTGDARLQALLGELVEGEAQASEVATENTDANVREAVPAPFTASEIALLDEIVEAMLTGDYEGAATIALSGSDVFALIFDTHTFHDFIYRDMFRFERHRVLMNNIHNGTGSFVYLSFHPLEDANEQGTWFIMITPFRDGQPNGTLEVHALNYGAARSMTATVPAVDGAFHGEAVQTNITRRGDVYTFTQTWVYGYKQPLGPPAENGFVPTQVRGSRHGERFEGYMLPENVASSPHHLFTRQLGVSIMFVEHWGGGVRNHFK